MRKLFTNHFAWALLSPLLVLTLLVPNLIQGKIPVPADSVLGLYHPWRDQSYNGYSPGKFPVKNPLITDPILQIYPWKKLTVENLKNKQLPLWNPYSFAGQPLLANIQSSPFQILSIFYFMSPFNVGWTINVIGPLIFASIFMYLFLKSLRLSNISSAFGAFIFPFSGFFTAWFTWNNVTATAMWTPLILLSVNKLFEKVNLLFFLVLIFSLFQVMVSGHTQIALYTFLAVFLYSFFNYLKTKKSVSLLITSSAFFLSFLISSPQILPALEFSQFSNREVDQEYISGKEDWFIPPRHLLQVLVPDYFGNPVTQNYWGVWNYAEFIGYIGIIPLIFSLTALLSKKRSKIFFIFLALVALLFAVENPISKIPYQFNLPFISSMQPSRIIFLFQFALIVLAALGMDLLIKAKEKKKLIVAPFLISSILLLLIIISKAFPNLFPVVKSLDTANIAFRNSILPFITAAIALILFTLPFKIPKKIIMFALLAITVAELYRFNLKFTPYSNSPQIFPSTEVTDFLSAQKRPFRVITTDRRILHPNTSAVYQIESVQGYDPLYLKEYSQLVSSWESKKVSDAASFNRIVTPQDFRSQIADFLNVKYVISFDELTDSKLVKVFEKGRTKIYENKSVLPRFFFVERIVEHRLPLEKLVDENFDLTKEAVSDTFSYNGIENLTSVYVDKYSDQSIVLLAETKNETPLVSSNVFYPGWKAYVDGKPTDILKVNHMFQSILVPAGKHIVEFKYEPTTIYNGFRLAAVGIFLTLAVSVYLWKRRFL